MNGYKKSSVADVSFRRQIGDLTIIVSMPDGMTWGFSIWRNTWCVGGRCDWGWSAEDAMREADRAAGELAAAG